VLLAISVFILTCLAFIDDLSKKVELSYFKTFLIKVFLISTCCLTTYLATRKQQAQSQASQNKLSEKNRAYEIGRDTSLKAAISKAQDSIVKKYTAALLQFGLTWKTDKNEIIKTLSDSVRKLHAMNINFPDLGISSITQKRSGDTITFVPTIRNKGTQAKNLTITCLTFVSVGNPAAYLPLDETPRMFVTRLELSNNQSLDRNIGYIVTYKNPHRIIYSYNIIFIVNYEDQLGRPHATNWLMKVVIDKNSWGQPLPEEYESINKFFKSNPQIYKGLQF
jgi:hypothetical protein